MFNEVWTGLSVSKTLQPLTSCRERELSVSHCMEVGELLRLVEVVLLYWHCTEVIWTSGLHCDSDNTTVLYSNLHSTYQHRNNTFRES